MDIRIGELRNKKVLALLQAHHDDMLRHSPVESVHALDVSALEADNVTFFSLWVDNELAGVGALKELNASSGEIKSMRTSPQFLRKGIAGKLLSYIIEESVRRSYNNLSLETGTASAFVPAQKLYQRFGFQPCEPFANYKEDPHSMFMSMLTKHLITSLPSKRKYTDANTSLQ